jgi:integrase
MFEAIELRTIIDKANQPLKAMILLGLNCGLGNSDCGQLKFRNLDLMKGWLNYPRPKTGVDRRCPLWKETIKALRDAIYERPDPRDLNNRDLVFITTQRLPWYNKGILWRTASASQNEELQRFKQEAKDTLGIAEPDPQNEHSASHAEPKDPSVAQ